MGAPTIPNFLLFQITSFLSFSGLIHSFAFLKKKYNEHSKSGSSTMALAFGFLQFICKRRSKLTIWLANFLEYFLFKTNLYFDEKFLWISNISSLYISKGGRTLENVPLEMISLHSWAETFFGKRSFWKEPRLLFIMSGMHLAHKMSRPFLPVQATVYCA